VGIWQKQENVLLLLFKAILRILMSF
jgi:hypothetical protein